MKRIVVGADGSAGSADAMRWAARLAARQGAELVAMTGFVPVDSELPPGRVEELVAEQRKKLESWSDVARLGEFAPRCVVEHGDPRPAILRVAEREEADLIVVGRVGRSAGPGLLHVGSMAEWLAHNSPRPVAVIGGAVDLALRSVLVGVDGSRGSRAAVSWVGALAAAGEVRVLAASVHQPFAEWTPATDPKNWRRELEREIREDFAAELIELGADLVPLALAGSNVAEALLQAARDHGADIVAVGSRGLGGFTGLRIGGAALRVLHRADRPVVIVPAGS